ncbi:MAG: lysophospholipase [Methylovulum sp.]|uniref:alpha/beta hydrolase n=1 Tax=Methylovulum sp. TaxID=1916980 RepID=UPI002628B747|nr:alpha/beta hydrolase [Methylovulum sp.]MDD2722495.1 lysophospholipase [Methylovulum sp.]MDD5125716.1 lysophospholipase [Methylovulum sp.]
MPKIHQPGPPIITSQLLKQRYLAADGVMLPLKQWLPTQKPINAVLIAVHGFNDYSQFFQQPAEFFSQQGIACYAYDQRGFGGSPSHGFWSGTAAYVQDLAVFIRLIHDKHPQLPVYLLGESMGAAVVIATLGETINPGLAGIILSAPAVWSRDTMPWYQQALLWSLAHTLPSLTLTGRGLKVQASDNIPMLKALFQDPLVIKATRVETLYGLADLMDTARHQAGKIDQTSLVLYGDNDQIIPKKPTYQFIDSFLQTQTQKKTVAFYENGYHMLLRDLNAPAVWQDIFAWIQAPKAPLPSKADRYARHRLGSNGAWL